MLIGIISFTNGALQYRLIVVALIILRGTSLTILIVACIPSCTQPGHHVCALHPVLADHLPEAALVRSWFVDFGQQLLLRRSFPAGPGGNQLCGCQTRQGYKKW